MRERRKKEEELVIWREGRNDVRGEKNSLRKGEDGPFILLS